MGRRPGKPRSYGARAERRILAALDEAPPKGYATWTGKLLARHLGEISADQVWRVLRRHRIHLQRRRSWCVSTDPEFARKAADIRSGTQRAGAVARGNAATVATHEPTNKGTARH